MMKQPEGESLMRYHARGGTAPGANKQLAAVGVSFCSRSASPIMDNRSRCCTADEGVRPAGYVCYGRRRPGGQQLLPLIDL